MGSTACFAMIVEKSVLTTRCGRDEETRVEDDGLFDYDKEIV